MNNPENQENLTFEEAIIQLRETVQSLEAGNATLDEATNLFEKGMNLANICNELLSRAELKVTNLQEEFEQQMQMLQNPENSED